MQLPANQLTMIGNNFCGFWIKLNGVWRMPVGLWTILTTTELSRFITQPRHLRVKNHSWFYNHPANAILAGIVSDKSTTKWWWCYATRHDPRLTTPPIVCPCCRRLVSLNQLTSYYHYRQDVSDPCIIGQNRKVFQLWNNFNVIR